MTTGLKMIKSSPKMNKFNRENYANIEENSFKDVNTNPLSTLSIDVDTASYTNILRMINKENRLPVKGAVRIEEMINYFNYNYPIKKGKDLTIHSELSNAPWSSNKLLLIGIKAKEIQKINLPQSNLVFLIDISGSMSSSLPLVKKSIKMLLKNLSNQDRVSIVTYAGSSYVRLSPTLANNYEKIENIIDSLKTEGFTNGGEGIELAYKMAKENFIKGGNNRVLLFTDGDFNMGNSSVSEIVNIVKKEKQNGIFLSVLGFGYGNLNDNMMEEMSNHGDGNYNYINDILDANKVFSKEMMGTLYAVGKDVKLQIEFNPKFVKKYRVIGYENRKLENEDFKNDTKDSGDIGAGDEVTFLYELEMNENNSSQKSDLKYQDMVLNQNANLNEIATVKIRYKLPYENKSKLLKKVISTDDEESINIKFASAVAAFGMKLRNSEYMKNLSFEEIINLAKESKGKDKNSNRAVFIKLVEKAKLLK
jgi:Ca-activated chloride channel family protein